MKNFLRKLIESIENAPLTLGSFLVAFFALIIVRLAVENTLGYFQEQSFFYLFFEFIHTFLFFLCSFILLLPVVSYAGKVDLKKSANLLLFGFLIMLTPPLIDRYIMGAGNYWSFYEFDGLFGLVQRFFTLFGDTPDIGITYGVRVEVVLVTLALGIYTALKSGSLRKSLFIALFSYTILFILGTFPSWITLPVMAFQKGLLAINGNDVAALFLSPEHVLGRDLADFRNVLNFKMSLVYALFVSGLMSLLLLRHSPRVFSALWKNARLPQLTWHAGLLFLGMSLGYYFFDGTFAFEFFPLLGIIILLIAVESAWLASVVVNDWYDTAIDAVTNPKRPLIKATVPRELYLTFGVIFFLISILFAGIVSFSAALILLAYQAIAWLYSAPPLRLKKYPGVATLCAAAAGLLVLIAGAISVTPIHDIRMLPLPLLSYLFAAYFLAIPVKDFKDIEGDRRDQVYTLPVLLGETLGKQVIGSLFFLLFAGSPFILHIRSLFLPALFFGGLTFLVMQRGTSQETSFFAFRKLPGILIALTAGYGLVIALFLL